MKCCNGIFVHKNYDFQRKSHLIEMTFSILYLTHSQISATIKYMNEHWERTHTQSHTRCELRANCKKIDSFHIWVGHLPFITTASFRWNRLFLFPYRLFWFDKCKYRFSWAAPQKFKKNLNINMVHFGKRNNCVDNIIPIQSIFLLILFLLEFHATYTENKSFAIRNKTELWRKTNLRKYIQRFVVTLNECLIVKIFPVGVRA